MIPPQDPRLRFGNVDLTADETGPTFAEPSNQLELGHAVSIPGYSDLQPLHQGGQGVVYRALQQSTKRTVAIKVLSGGAYATEAARRRFQREVEIVAQLGHPNIVSIFDSGRTPDGLLFFVMEFIDGLMLDQHIRQKKLPLQEALGLFLPILDAVEFAHRNGVIHRDLKPSNILVDESGNPKVVDFGLARALLAGQDSFASMTGQVLGTFAYMSPEQVRGRTDEIDGRTDVYSIGMILYEICTGRSPYPVDSQIMEVLRHITETVPDPPSRAWSSETGLARRSVHDRKQTLRCPIDSDLETILLRTIAKETDRRYATVHELAEDLAAYLDGRPISAKRDSGIYRIRKELARNRRVALALVIVLGALGLAALSLVLLPRETVREAPVAAETESRIRFLAGETEYAEVRQQLMATLKEREAAGEADPVAGESLGIVQDAVRELRAALEADPGNESLQELLLANYQREIRLLRRMCEKA
jgi:non-specific serine/threonine protein kinase/serine/threonine-protein kinase